MSLFLTWTSSGHQRTEILMKTGAYHKHKQKKTIATGVEEENDSLFEEIKSIFWKGAIIFYEVALSLSIFSLLTFWIFWHNRISDHQRNDHFPGGEVRETPLWMYILRRIITTWLNVIPPLYLLIDFSFSKLVFKYRHIVFHFLLALAFLGVLKAGERILNDRKAFAIHFEDLFSMYSPFGFLAIALIHFAFCFISKLKYQGRRDPRYYGGEDAEVEKIVKKYKKSIDRHRELIANTISSRGSFLPSTDDSEYRFMREVIYSYLDQDIKRKRRDWGSESSKIMEEESS